MSSTVIFVGLPEGSKSSVTKALSVTESAGLLEVTFENSAVNTCLDVVERGVPNAPKSCIAEIFSSDSPDGSPVKNGGGRPRVQRDTPTRPRDTHSRLFGQGNANSPAPMVTDTIRSHIQFGDAEVNGSAAHSPAKLANGSANSTPSREGNPITGDGYKSLNGQINTVTSINGRNNLIHNRVPPGGYSSGLW
ncbi:PREDICTED: microtubule-associated protein Jupiter isoform X4 [Papilio polytes]|uniref:microtubule-associated protein Jupiter isoform X4 n=1 Tax=Papilio polytes TaxID=76194 RepID=UPI0006766648|nr:PREDICTED: microtubule-associated protein Jupiter isoform X4 [Papilio polytes]